jgi:hypothetical protein
LVQSFNYNTLETLYLVTSMFVLLAGMAFQSGVAVSGGVAHSVLTWIVALVLVTSVSTFFGVLAMEVWRSLVFARKATAAMKRASQLGVPTVLLSVSEAPVTVGSTPGVCVDNVDIQTDIQWHENPARKVTVARGWTMPNLNDQHHDGLGGDDEPRTSASQSQRRIRVQIQRQLELKVQLTVDT